MALCVKCLGVINFLVGGQSIRLSSDGDITIYASTQTREESFDGEFTISDRNPRVEATLVVPKTVYVTTLVELCNTTLGVELCDGRTFSMTGASQVGEGAYNAKKNTIDVQFIAALITEVLPIAA